MPAKVAELKAGAARDRQAAGKAALADIAGSAGADRPSARHAGRQGRRIHLLGQLEAMSWVRDEHFVACARRVACHLAGRHRCWRFRCGVRLMAPRPPDTCLATSERPGAPDAGMQWIPAGRFAMGSEQFRAEEAPVRETAVDGFWIDTHDVTNAQFARFVRETGYVTTAERQQRDAAVPRGRCCSARPRRARPAGRRPVVADRARAPTGVTRMDRAAISRVGKTIPWCTCRMRTRRPTRRGRAARCRPRRNGSSRRAAAATASRSSGARRRTATMRRRRTTGAACLPGAQHRQQGLQGHLAGRLLSAQRVWALRHGRQCVAVDAGCVDRRPQAEQPDQPLHQLGRNGQQRARPPTRKARASYVIKGGSFLCAANFCMRYRPAARQPGDASTGASHIGFRTVLVP